MSQDAVSVRTEQDGKVVTGIVGDTDTNRAAVDSSGNLAIDISAATAEPLDVSGATVNVQEDTALDVSGAVVSVQEDTALDVSAATVNVQEASPLDVSAATVTVTDDGSLDATVTQSSFGNLFTDSNLYVGQTAVSASNPVPVKQQEESATPTSASYQESSPLSSQATETLEFTANGTSSEIQSIIVSAELAFSAEIQTYDGTASTTVGYIHGDAGSTEKFVPETKDTSFFQSSNEFRVIVKNNNSSSLTDSAPIHVTFEQQEV